MASVLEPWTSPPDFGGDGQETGMIVDDVKTTGERHEKLRKRSEIVRMLDEHERVRRRSLGLVASENVMSPAA